MENTYHLLFYAGGEGEGGKREGVGLRVLGKARVKGKGEKSY